MNEIVFPMTLDYVSDWTSWDVVREIVSNSFDVDPGFRMGIDENKTFWVEDSGDGLAVKSLLFGVSEKANPEKSRGQFGEGLKLALLVLTRMGYHARVYSNDLVMWNEHAQLHGQEVFKIVWEQVSPSRQGTRVEIANWSNKSYESRFLRPGDPRIIFTDPFGRSVLDQDAPDIFVKGVWVQKANHGRYAYTFGYDLKDVKMNRDRGVIDSWEANGEIGKTWASVTDQGLLERFWQAVKDYNAESSCHVFGHDIASRQGFERAFKSVYGERVVVKTGDVTATEAQYRGAEPLETVGLSFSLKQVMTDLVGTDTEYVNEMEGRAAVYVPDKKLEDDQARNIKLARRLAKRVGHDGKVQAYVLQDGVAMTQNGEIKLSLGVLADAESTIQSLLHELAHVLFGTNDATADHVSGVARVASNMVLSYARR